MPQRTRPLSAGRSATAMPDDREVLEMLEDLQLDANGTDDPERQARFAAGVRALRVGSASTALSERILLVLGGILAPLGLVVVVLGWWGASRTSYPFEQTPYLISGGLLGLGLVFLGSFFYFAHWLTQLVKEHRQQSAAILAALERLADQLADQR
jgi:hypothetical protein